MVYTKKHEGLYADGTFGHQYARGVLAFLVNELEQEGMQDLIDSLDGKMPDDAWDEGQALEVLQGVTEEGLFWEFKDGDLVLSSNDEEEEEKDESENISE